EDRRHHAGERRPARNRQSTPVEPTHHVQYSPEPVLCVLLQRARSASGGWRSVPVLRIAAEPDDRRRRNELQLGVRDYQCTQVESGKALGNTITVASITRCCLPYALHNFALAAAA